MNPYFRPLASRSLLSSSAPSLGSRLVRSLVWPATLPTLSIGLIFGLCACEQPSKDVPAPPKVTISKSAVKKAFPASTANAGAPQKPVAAPSDVAKPPASATELKSGVAFTVLKPGEGDGRATKDDQVVVHYTGWTRDGTMFDDSRGRLTPTRFFVGATIEGWQHIVTDMAIGESRRVWVPAALAYGTEAKSPNAPAGDLTFDIELLSVIKGPTPPKAPADLKKPPATAKTLASGMKMLTLAPGTGEKKPKGNDRVRVNYTGWTKDGTMFDSTVMRRRSLTVGLDTVIQGWREALPLMTVGQKVRLWVPSALGYGDKPARTSLPAGDLVFEVELVAVQPAPPGKVPGGHQGHGH